MKILRLVWDHPASTAYVAVALWLLAPIIASHPLASIGIAVVAALSLWASWRRSSEYAEVLRSVSKAELDALEAQIKVQQRMCAVYREAGQDALRHIHHQG